MTFVNIYRRSAHQALIGRLRIKWECWGVTDIVSELQFSAMAQQSRLEFDRYPRGPDKIIYVVY